MYFAEHLTLTLTAKRTFKLQYSEDETNPGDCEDKTRSQSGRTPSVSADPTDGPL